MRAAVRSCGPVCELGNYKGYEDAKNERDLRLVKILDK
jgi:hypothetical protein